MIRWNKGSIAVLVGVGNSGLKYYIYKHPDFFCLNVGEEVFKFGTQLECLSKASHYEKIVTGQTQ